MDERDASEAAEWRNAQHELWLAMQTAYSQYKHASDVLETMVSPQSGDGPFPHDTLSVESAADKQRAAFENYIESRLRFSDFLHERHQGATPDGEPSPTVGAWPAVRGTRLAFAAMVVALFGAMALGARHLARVDQEVRELTATHNELIATLHQTRDGMMAIVGKMNALKANQQFQNPRPAKIPQLGHWRPTPVHQQQNRMFRPRATAGRPRTDLPGWLHSIDDDQHERGVQNQEVLARPEKLGMPAYHHFTLTMPPQFVRVGPLRMSLLLVNFVNRDFDLCFVTDDLKLYKKHGSLNEPVRIGLADPPRSLELVVNSIDRNRVQGYLTVQISRKSVSTTSQIRRSGPGGGS